jgi:hypothetical protein
MKCVRHVAHVRDTINAYKIFIRKSEGKRPRRKPRRRLENNIKINLREIGWEVME